MTKQELIENIKAFNIEKYYLEDTENVKENSAVLIITDNQFILTKSLNNGKTPHAPTFADIYQLIYDINDPELLQMNQMMKTVKINAQYGNENITARMLNENNQKVFLLHFPKQISKNQYQLLRQFNDSYGETLNMLTLEEKPLLIGIENNPIIAITNFEDAITYASIKVNETIISSDTSDERVVGKTVITPSTKKR